MIVHEICSGCPTQAMALRGARGMETYGAVRAQRLFGGPEPVGVSVAQEAGAGNTSASQDLSPTQKDMHQSAFELLVGALLRA
jgi:hypothetical protein